MSSEAIPEHLIALKARNLRAEQQLAELSPQFPPAVDIAAGTATPSPELQERWDAAWAEQQETAVAIQTDAWWAQTEDRHAAREALLTAARQRLS